MLRHLLLRISSLSLCSISRLIRKSAMAAGPDGKVRTYKSVEGIPIHELKIVKP
jgi:hypothetical protein